jgi:hypothetical protein
LFLRHGLAGRPTIVLIRAGNGSQPVAAHIGGQLITVHISDQPITADISDQLVTADIGGPGQTVGSPRPSTPYPSLGFGRPFTLSGLPRRTFPGPRLPTGTAIGQEIGRLNAPQIRVRPGTARDGTRNPHAVGRVRLIAQHIRPRSALQTASRKPIALVRHARPRLTLQTRTRPPQTVD